MVAPTRPHLSGARLVLVMLALALLVTFGAGPATAVPNAGSAPRYYLSLGDSLSRGVQPDLAGQNHPTDQSYADDLANVGRLVLPELQLVKLGCETEETTTTTTTSMLGGGRCAYASDAQLADAEAFLRVTATPPCWSPWTLGANDLGDPLQHSFLDVGGGEERGHLLEVPNKRALGHPGEGGGEMGPGDATSPGPLAQSRNTWWSSWMRLFRITSR